MATANPLISVTASGLTGTYALAGTAPVHPVSLMTIIYTANADFYLSLDGGTSNHVRLPAASAASPGSATFELGANRVPLRLVPAFKHAGAAPASGFIDIITFSDHA